jgi:plastocyanin
MNTIFGNKIITALILTLLIFATGAPASAKAGATVAPAVLGFGSQTVGTASTPALVTFSNNTNSSMKIVGVSLSQTQFTYSGPALPVTLSPGQGFTGTVVFSPTGAQAYNDTLKFTRANGMTAASSLSGTGVQSSGGGPVIPPTSLALTVAPCDSNFNCVAGTTDAVSQWVRITAHVAYTGTTSPTGTLCVLDNGSPANCGLTPAADENWFVNSLAGGTHKLSATYAGNSSYGASTSGISTLIVGSATPPSVVAPTITLQPVSQTVAPGKTATFSVQVTGTAPLTYQWSKSGTVIPAATSASYTTPATTLADNSAQFVLVVSNSAGTSTSTAAALKVIAPIPPTSLALTVAPCDSNFNCVAGTTGAVSQWVRITAHVVYTGTTNPTGTLCVLDNGSPANCGLTPAADENWFVNTLAAGTHKLSATYAGNSSYGASTSAIATLVVGSTTPQVVAPTITLQPVSQTVAPGKTATFSVQVTGTAPLTYQWSKSGTVIPTATSASYTTPATTLADNSAQFVLVVSNSAGTSTSSTAVLSVSSTTPVLTTNPSSLSFGNTTVGTSNSLSVALTNSGTSNVSISNTSISGAGFTASGMSGTILTPGQSASLNVTFAPSGAGTISGSISVTSNAATAKITLSGNGIQPAMTSITVTPANQTVSVGNQVQYQAMDNLGNDVTSSVNWSSSDSSIVTISATGLAIGVADGSATVAATK